jgi:polyisoprenoid-binding protein YceI
MRGVNVILAGLFLLPLAGAISGCKTDAPAAHTQPRHFVSALAGQKIRLLGRSNIHDWEINGQTIKGGMEINPEALFHGQTGKVPAKAEIQIPVRSLKSGNELMDAVFLDLVQADQFPTIGFTLTELTKTNVTTKGLVECAAKGDLRVARVTNQLALMVTIMAESPKCLKLTGIAMLRYSSYKINPPAPTRPPRTNDQVEITFTWVAHEQP